MKPLMDFLTEDPHLSQDVRAVLLYRLDFLLMALNHLFQALDPLLYISVSRIVPNLTVLPTQPLILLR